jgi:hypothetical protein
VAHGTILRSLVTNSTIPCAATIIMHYIQSFANGQYDSGVPLDTSCLAHLKHVAFAGQPDTNINLLGTADLYVCDVILVCSDFPTQTQCYALQVRWICTGAGAALNPL